MDLDFNDEQNMLREMVRGVCAAHAGLGVVREMEDDAHGYPEAFWRQLVDLDLVGLLLPESVGGSGMSMLEGVVVYEEFGRALAPSPHFASAVMAAGALLAAGREDEVRSIASGETIVVPAWLEPESGFSSLGVQVRGDEDSVTGTKWHVPFAAAADRFLVLARTGDDDAVGLHLVDNDASVVDLAQQKTIASDTQYAVTFDGAPATLVAEHGWALWERQMLDGVILLAAQAVGGAEQALDITVQYAKDRFQFGKPLGAFQAIAHYLSDAVTAVDGARTLVYEAAWARAEGRDISRLAPMAKLFAANTFRDVTAMAQQVWGGVGFTNEYDIQLYFRRAKQLQISWWDTRALEERVAVTVLDEPVPA